MSNRIEDQRALSARRGESAQRTLPEALIIHHSIAGELDYAPHQLLDTLQVQLRLKNDAALSRRLNVRPSVISKVRNQNTAVSAQLLITMHEESGLTIRDLRWLMGDRRERFTPAIFKGMAVVE